MTVRDQVMKVATEIIRATPNGIRWADLHRAVNARLPEPNKNTIHGALHYFRNNLPTEISKPERGLYVFGPQSQPVPAQEAPQPRPSKYKEEDFYQPFAEWLKVEVEEATVAVPLGGSALGSKWGTPDVIGLFRPRATDPIKFPEEVLAAEIKTDTNQMIVAFGQACAYKLFAHRVYLVVPRTAPKADLQRLDALAGVVGIGLVRFNAEDPSNPAFEIMARAAKHEPDFFYMNHAIAACQTALGL